MYTDSNMDPSPSTNDCKYPEDETVIEIPEPVTVEARTDVCHPLLDKSNRKHKDEDEREENMVVIVEVRGKRYRVDFGKYDEDYQQMPRCIKKQLAIEDIEESLKAEEEAAAQLQLEKDRVEALQSAASKNLQKQEAKKGDIRDRLRAMLLRKNPLRKDVKGTEGYEGKD